MIRRYYDDLEKLIIPNRVLVIYGPRQVGKTTLLKQYLATTKWRYKLDSGDNLQTQQILSSQNFAEILPFAEGYELIAIDEAQHISNIGMGLKILVDQIPNIRLIATGSSSFALAHQVGEPLVGRKYTIILYPFSQLELLSIYTKFELKQKLEEFLIFGSYPQVLTAKTRLTKISVLNEIVNSYLFNDILAFDRIKGAKSLLNLVKLLAFQVGSEVSLNELSLNLAIDVKTVARYLDLLEKTFVITNLGGLSRNLRKEVCSKYKYYFIDLGIRNAVISQFNKLTDRNDIGQLWENFIFMERLKKRAYKNTFANMYFWRTYDKQEIDLVEEREGKFYAFEFKFGKTKKRVPQLFVSSYSNSTFQFINQNNYLDFVC